MDLYLTTSNASFFIVICTAFLLAIMVKRWLTPSLREATSRALIDETDDFSSRAARQILLPIIDAILGARALSWTAFIRASAFGTTLLFLLLGVCGIRTDQFMGLSDYPWNLFLDSLGILKKVSDPTAKAYAARFSQGYWDIAYTAVAVPIAILLNAGMFWTSLVASRLFLGDMRVASSWLQKASLLLTLAMLTGVIANIAAFLLSLLTSVIPWAVAILTGGHALYMIVAGLGSNLFTIYVGDLWIRVLLLCSLLPALAPLCIVVPAMGGDIIKTVSIRSRVAVTERLARSRSDAVMALIIVLLIIAWAIWLLLKIL